MRYRASALLIAAIMLASAKFCPARAASATCASLKDLKLPHTTITLAQEVAPVASGHRAPNLRMFRRFAAWRAQSSPHQTPISDLKYGCPYPAGTASLTARETAASPVQFNTSSWHLRFAWVSPTLPPIPVTLAALRTDAGHWGIRKK